MDAKKREKALRIFAKVLNDIKPSKLETEATTASVNKITSELLKIVPKDVEIKVVGSIARGTELKGNSDIDIFLLFGKKVGKDKVTEYGIRYGKELAKRMGGRYEIRYAEHPYLRLYIPNIGADIDIVPAYKIINITEMGTTVDRTPLHNDFINMHLNDKQRDDVRLLKALLNSHGIYGAEVKTRGFSGYLCELLVYHYRSLLNLLEEATQIKLPYYLNPLNPEEKGSKEIFEKFNSDFVVIDPVDPNRNVAAVVSHESLSKFIVVAKMFIENPSEKMFYGYKVSSADSYSMLRQYMKANGLSASLLVVPIPDKSEDITWPQLKKLSGAIVDYVARNGFQVYIELVTVKDREGLVLYMYPSASAKTRMLKGPSVPGNSGAALSFINAHLGSSIIFSNSTLYVMEKVRYESMNEAIADFIKREAHKKHKDIKLSKAKLASTIPERYAEHLYWELLAKTSI